MRTHYPGMDRWIRVLSPLARIVRIITGLLAGVLVLAVLLVVLDANEDNGIVAAILDAARFLGRPFREMFELDDAKTELAVNWGIAAGVYLLAGALIVALLAAIGRSVAGRGRRRTERTD